MNIGYIRVSKVDGSQNFNLQKDALINYGVLAENTTKIKHRELKTIDQVS
ncbi:hypothetical protein phytr_10650 [Candidatus Phycorickettsia trachydisci]|uniref:Resolvase/invertase-type recombinase catalytic domain-containing protein n=1 Tax=Candidatus Phycorickettsia trachydisci TaxID=2115978 RepID=A0A2P1P9P5_9RICK|nr:hypothetical protein phytr_10650 [Candidatus Phycorickettsia trachydisci]